MTRSRQHPGHTDHGIHGKLGGDAVACTCQPIPSAMATHLEAMAKR